jgi:trans-aconitate methyltransferase
VSRSGDRRKSIVADGYDAMADAYMAWAASIRDDPRDQMIAALTERVPAGGRVLDLGCGSGLPSTKVLAERFEVVGVEASMAQIERARVNVPGATFMVGDLTAVDCPAGSFDAVTAPPASSSRSTRSSRSPCQKARCRLAGSRSI